MKKLITNETFLNIKNQHVLTHWQDGLEILRVIDGTMQCLINGKEYTIRKDDICIINQNQLHRIYCDKTNDTTRFQCLKIEMRNLNDDEEVVKKYIEPILNDVSFSHIISSTNQPFAKEIANLMDVIEEVERLQTDGYELLVISYLHMIFQKIYIHYTTPNIKKSLFIDTEILLYQKLADYIYKNYDQKITLKDITTYGNISKNKCCALFAKYTQHTPIDFLNLYRLEVSTEMLKMTNARISDISFACGIGQPSYYNRLFLKKYGMTPLEYRKSMQTTSH